MTQKALAPHSSDLCGSVELKAFRLCLVIYVQEVPKSAERKCAPEDLVMSPKTCRLLAET